PSSECRTDADGWKRFVGGDYRSHLLRVSEASHCCRTGPPEPDLLERAVVLPIREVHRRGQSHVAGRHRLELCGVPNANQRAGLRIGQRSNQNAVEDTEDRGCRADAEPECEDSNRREAWVLAE